jgi:hypothetical protein
MRTAMSLISSAILAGVTTLASATPVQSVLTPFESRDEAIVLKNDAFQDGGGQAYLQLGFVAQEMAGVWVQVPAGIPLFKVDYFRVLMGSSRDGVSPGPVEDRDNTIYFQMGIAPEASQSIPAEIVNAASVTPGPYWNDIPAQGESGTLGCAHGGEMIGAAVEFTHAGAPSVYRDLDGLANVKFNTLFAVPGGWNYSVAYGLRGDWILRVVGHAAKPDECT